MLLSSRVRSNIKEKNRLDADKKCQMSCLSKNKKVHSWLKCLETDGLSRADFSGCAKKYSAPTAVIAHKRTYTRHVQDSVSDFIVFQLA